MTLPPFRGFGELPEFHDVIRPDLLKRGPHLGKAYSKHAARAEQRQAEYQQALFDYQTAAQRHALQLEDDRRRHDASVARQVQEHRQHVEEVSALQRSLAARQPEAVVDEAAYDAYRWWTPTVDPTVMLAREAEQRAHARRADDQDPDRTDPGPVESTPTGDDADLTRADAVEADLAAAESALSLIRGQGQRRGFTGDHAQLVGQLRQVLDESPVWDTITPDTSVHDDHAQMPPLEPALRPETVRPWDDWDDMIVLDAAFAGTTITVLRPPGRVGPLSYVFMCLVPGQRSIMQAADITTMGMIASGDRQPEPGHAAEYEKLGQQVRKHLIGLVDTVAEARELRTEQEGRRLVAAQANLGSPVEAAYQRPRPTRGTGR